MRASGLRGSCRKSFFRVAWSRLVCEGSNVDPNLLVTKIIVPSKRSDVLSRRGLLDFMHEYIGRKLLLVSAAAGYGKTSLLVDFAHDTRLPVCWYSLDEGDRDPQVFLEYLVAAIQRQFPHFGGRTTALLHSGDEKGTLTGAIGALVTEIYEQINTLFVLVLDDYHLVESSQPINQLLDRFLAVLPENAHLILASRTLPAYLNVTLLTAKQQVAGLGAADLRFTADEIRAFVLQNYGLEIAPAIAADMAAQSEGWITGIVLTTPTLWRGLLHEWIKGYGPGSQLFEYLAGEVLLQQTADLQQFLLDTSVLGEMNGALCNELLGRSDADALLQLAEKRNLFITRLEDQGYRYHHLFREFLLTRLRQTQRARHDTLLQKAASLFERRNKPDLAIENWIAAGELEQAARLTNQIAESYFQQGRWTTLTRWLDTLGEAEMSKEPRLLLWRAMLGVEAGEIELAQRTFAQALEEFERRGDTLNVARTLIESARRDEQPARAIKKCERALAILPPREFVLQALGNRTMGGVVGQRGDHWGAITLFERASELLDRANDRYLQSETENDLGAVYTILGKRTKAEEHFQNARAFWERISHPAKLANTLNSIAVLRYEQGELSRAHELLLEALKQSHDSGYLRIEAYVLASLGDVYRDQGKWADALDSYMSSADLAKRVHEGFLIIFTQVAAAGIWRMTREFSTAEGLLNTALNSATLHDSDYQIGIVQMGLGALALARQDTEGAVRHLKYALPLVQQAQAKRDMGRTHFFLAQAAIQRKQTNAAMQHLRTLAALGTELDEDQFLWSESSHAPFVVEFALTRKSGLAYYRRLAQKLAQRPAAASSEAVVLEPSYPHLELYALGEARVIMDGVPVPKSVWQTTTTQELFFFFAMNPQGLRKEQVIAQLWADSPVGQASDLFHASVYRIRRALFAECLIYQNGLYQLNPEIARWLDVEAFEKALSAADQAPTPEEKIQHLEHAAELYHGDLMSDSYADWCNGRREQLHTRALDAMERLARMTSEAGNPGRAIHLYHQALLLDPLDEPLYRGLMEAYAALGNLTAVRQTYQQCVERLDQDLGVPPMPETESLYRRLVT